VIYIDTSVVLAHLLPETRRPDETIWQERLVSSRLLEYEVWNRIHAYKLAVSHSDKAQELIGRMLMVEMTDSVLGRAFHPFPVAVKTLDALHLATIDFLRRRGREIELASYDNRMLAAAQAMGVPIASL